MQDSAKEIVKPAGEAVMPSVHPDVSPHVETVHDMEHLGRIHSELSAHGVKTTGELTQVLTEPQVLDSAQFEVERGTTVAPQTPNDIGKLDDPSRWNLLFKRKQEERRLKRAA
ncbi:MAG: hypothetical protein HY427_02915 [Candidatus Levybacteria bacterium]|nr:hypothetical protein [Candidatus Levybacteria bacterium]